MDKSALDAGKIFILILLSFSTMFMIFSKENTTNWGETFIAGIYILEFLWLSLFAFKHFKKLFLIFYIFLFFALLDSLFFKFGNINDINEISSIIYDILFVKGHYNNLNVFIKEDEGIVVFFEKVTNFCLSLNILLLPFACLGTYIFCKEKRKQCI